MRLIKTSTIILILLALGSCGTPCHQAVPIEVPFPALDKAVDQAACDPHFVKTEWVPDCWWTLFADRQLDFFVEKALEKNPSLQIAQAKIASAQYAADRARSVFYPSVLINGDVQRVRLSENSPFVPSPAAGALGAVSPLPRVTVPLNVTQIETYVDLNYEFDFWGKNKNTVLAILGDRQARVADEAFTRLVLSISVSDVYFQLQTRYERRHIIQALMNNREKYYHLTERRFQNNLDNDINLLAAKNEALDVNLLLLQLEGEIAILEHQLRAFLADTFDEPIFELPISQKALPKVPLPNQLPLYLIAHRPDIISQLWIIESAERLIDVARAGFYPNFNLMDIVGFQAQTLNKLFIPASRFGDLEPSFSLPFFQGGRLIANLRSSEVDYDLAILKYNELVLEAVKQVLDGLSLVQNAHLIQAQYQQETDNQSEITRLTKLRQEYNLSSEFDEVNAEKNFLLLKDKEIIALGQTLHATLGLIKSLGGGFECTIN